MMTNEQLNQIEARANAATPGPWTASMEFVEAVVQDITDGSGELFCCVSRRDDTNEDRKKDEADAAFIAHAREDIPAFIAEVRRLRETVARLREEVALLNAHINKRNADDFHALAEHQHEVNTLRARIEAGIAAAHEGREEIIAAVNSIPFGERLDKIVAALHEGEDRR